MATSGGALVLQNDLDLVVTTTGNQLICSTFLSSTTTDSETEMVEFGTCPNARTCSVFVRIKNGATLQPCSASDTIERVAVESDLQERWICATMKIYLFIAAVLLIGCSSSLAIVPGLGPAITKRKLMWQPLSVIVSMAMVAALTILKSTFLWLAQQFAIKVVLCQRTVWNWLRARSADRTDFRRHFAPNMR